MLEAQPVPLGLDEVIEGGDEFFGQLRSVFGEGLRVDVVVHDAGEVQAPPELVCASRRSSAAGSLLKR